MFHISCAWIAGFKLQRSDFQMLVKDQELKIWYLYEAFFHSCNYNVSNFTSFTAEGVTAGSIRAR
jgi:hypothetical protein